MTIHQPPAGAKTDYGTIGFEKNVSGQVLIERLNEEVEEIKNQVRQAMKILEEGKQMAAFNLLKHIVE